MLGVLAGQGKVCLLSKLIALEHLLCFIIKLHINMLNTNSTYLKIARTTNISE